MPKTVSDVKVVTHKLAPAGKVSVTPFIGERQDGFWTVHYDGKVIGSGTGAEPVEIGDVNTLLGMNIEVSAAIKDINPLTDRLSLELELTSGKTDPEPMIEHDGGPGAIAVYSIVVFFV